MGNCQAADAAAVVIQHPASGRTELAYWSLPAGEVMAANPGHYVAAVITAPHTASEGPGAAPPVKHLKLLRPDDTLLLGRVYRLVSFEEVLKEFATKRHVKLSRVMVKAKDDVAPTKPAKPRRRRGSSGADAGVVREESDRSLAKIMRQSVEEEEKEAAAGPTSGPVPKPGADDNNGVAASEPGLDDDDDDCDLESLLPPGLALGRRLGPQWRPALQSIAEGRD
ncbi:hypothetical protein CFC21_058577 [Triticum aestivum]|uniref:Uncharacterized protein n=3 Tax=Triticum TaxID=4564 RepID=A0A9R0TAF0_TRITD|nr:uncharacterized protein LOC119291345 [Triticum dicoccoides]XP_044372869.1 uncharacterized protein LOC123095113 [Triticum aestivum]KAF7050180.1 hypothetical protein CFC21_058577 [Triticum aestivum]VAI08729.1 unnamed protein product [Triticum turgidum subsp. durum]